MIKINYLVFVSVLLLSSVCQSQTTFWSIRGGFTLGPENTIEATDLAFGLGADGTEIDVWNTAPHPDTGKMEIILQHDRAVDRLTDGTGQIQTLQFDYVRSLDAGSKPHELGVAFPDAIIPTLSEALTFSKDNGKDVLLHVKRDIFNLGGEVPVGDIQTVIDEVGFPEGKLFTWTYLKEDAAEFQEKTPTIKVIFQGGENRSDIDYQELRELGVSGIQIFNDLQRGNGQLNQQYVDEIHANGFFTFVNFPTLRELDDCLDWGVDYVMHFKVAQYVPIIKAHNNSLVLLGDVNKDSVVNFLDIAPFINLLSVGEFQAEADCNQDGIVDFLDISFFISMLN